MADPKGYLVVPVAFRSDGSIHGLELDNSDRLKVLVDSITGNVTVVQTDASQLLVGAHGWNGSAWRKLQVDSSDRLKVLIDSVTGDVPVSQPDNSFLSPVGAYNTVSNLSLPAGNSTQTIFTVPTSQRIQLDHVAIQYTGTVAGVTLRAAVVRSSVIYPFASYTGITSGQIYHTPVSLILEAGDDVVARILGATLNDDFVGYEYHRRMK